MHTSHIPPPHLNPGNNKIKVLESLMYLRQFRKLKVVNLDGNPVCDESDYKSTMYAYMPWLEYLDYAFIDDAKRKEARDLHQVRGDDVTQYCHVSDE